MHAYIITGINRQSRIKEINRLIKEFDAHLFDQIYLGNTDGATSIGIAQVREFQRLLTLAPTSGKIRLGLINFAERLTVEAQQALLKTLEEPPPHGKIILEAQTTEMLLPTIISRCQIITLAETEKTDQNTLELCRKTIEQIQQSTTGKRLQIIDTIGKTREEISTWITLAIFAARESLLNELNTEKIEKNKPAVSNSELLRKLLLARQQIWANVNPKLVLDNIFLQ